jgi:hypothetical protein
MMLSKKTARMGDKAKPSGAPASADGFAVCVRVLTWINAPICKVRCCEIWAGLFRGPVSTRDRRKGMQGLEEPRSLTLRGGSKAASVWLRLVLVLCQCGLSYRALCKAIAPAQSIHAIKPPKTT